MPEERNLSPYYVGTPTPAPSGLGTSDLFSSGLNLRRIWVVLYKRRFLIAIAIAVVSAMTLMSERSAPQVYVASAQLRIDPVSPATASGDVASMLVDYSYYRTEYLLLESPTLAKRVIRALKLYDDPRFLAAPKPVGRIGHWREETLGRVKQWTEKAERGVGIAPPAAPAEAPAEKSDDDARAEALVQAYLAGLKVSPIENSRLVTITYTSPDPSLCAAIANKHAEEFKRMAIEAQVDLNDEAQQILDKRLAELGKRTEESETKLNDFRREHRVLAVGGNEKENVALERLSSLTGDYSKAQAERIAAEAEYDLVKKRKYDQLSSVQRDPTYNALKEQLEQMKTEYGRLSQIYKGPYPKMVALQGQIDALEARIRDQVRRGISGVESQYLSAKGKEDALAKEIESTRKDVLDLNDLTVEYQVLAKQAEADRQLYTNLVTQSRAANLASSVQSSNVRIVEPARTPPGPSLLAVQQSLPRAIVLGLMIGIGLAFLLDYFDSTIKTPEDSEEFLQLPSLAVVPSFSYHGPQSHGRLGLRRLLGFKRKRKPEAQPILLSSPEGSSSLPPKIVLPGSRRAESARPPKADPTSELLVVERPHSAIAEAYRTLRTAILLSSADKPHKVIQVVSTGSREGKTVTGVNIALTLAQAGARVLLIDADLRRPRVHSIFRLTRSPGLVDYLVGHSPLEQCIRPIAVDEIMASLHGVPSTPTGNGHSDVLKGSISVLPAGTRAPNPAELLGSRRMSATLAAFREDYDFIIVDSPPVLPVADSVVLGTMVDASVLVIRGEVTPKNMVRQALLRLERGNAKVIGTVLNDADVTSGDYYYYKGYYAAYGYLDSHKIGA